MKLDIARFRNAVKSKYFPLFQAGVKDLVVAKAMKNRALEREALFRLEKVMKETMGIAEVIGATEVLKRAAAEMAAGGEMFTSTQATLRFSAATVVPAVTFEEAVDNMLERVPVTLASAAQRTAANVSKLYSEGSNVAFSRSADQAVTARVQRLLAELIKGGFSEVDSGRMIVKDVDTVREKTEEWSEAYARTVFRTNLNTAQTAGRFRQLQDRGVSDFIPALMFTAVGDGDTRDNHGALNGKVFRADNPVWRTIAPPLGYNCRCQVDLVTRPQLRRMGRLRPGGGIHEDSVPHGAGPDAGFRAGDRVDLIGIL